jgi:hypothetical protein
MMPAACAAANPPTIADANCDQVSYAVFFNIGGRARETGGEPTQAFTNWR